MRSSFIGLELTNQASLAVQCVSEMDPLSVPHTMGLRVPASMLALVPWVLGLSSVACACRISVLLTEPPLPRRRLFKVYRRMDIDTDTVSFNIKDLVIFGFWYTQGIPTSK